MNDPEGDEYYRRKQQRADDTAWLFLKIVFFIGIPTVMLNGVYTLGKHFGWWG